MEIETVIRAILSLGFVIGLMLGCLALYKKFFMGRNITTGKVKRMEVVEYLYLDRQRKMVIVKKDDQEITILIGMNGEQIVK